MSEEKDTINNTDRDDEYEKICFVCRRPEGKTGHQVTMPGNISICSHCLQRTFDMMEQSGMAYNMSDLGNLSGMNFGAMDMSQIMNLMSGGMSKKPDASMKETVSNSTDDNQNEQTEPDNKSDNDSDSKSDNKSDNKEQKEETAQKMPRIQFLNLADLQGEFPRRQKIKKKQSGDKKPPIDITKIPAPHKIKEQLDEYVVGQEHAKKVISVAVYNHYKRICADVKDGIEIEKSNMLMIGPTGSGKTFLVKTLAKLLDVPLAIADATSLTEAGYIGDDIESVVSKLLAAADNDVDKAETGIIFIDEIDKIAKKRNASTRDVSGESVQQGLLKLLEGSEVEVPVGANSKNAMVPLATINTSNILFICGGAFPDLEDIIKERLNKQASIGFIADLKDKYDNVNDLIAQVTVDDLKTYGMIPEFLGRLPIVYTLEGLTTDLMIKVLKEPKNAILKQYQKLLELDEVELVFEEEAIECIANKAVEKKTGARALRSIIEEFMLDIMFEIPKDDNIGTVRITKEYIEKTGGPIIEMRGIEKTVLETSV